MLASHFLGRGERDLRGIEKRRTVDWFLVLLPTRMRAATSIEGIGQR